LVSPIDLFQALYLILVNFLLEIALSIREFPKLLVLIITLLIPLALLMINESHT
jgi:hypothetical protein